MVAGIPSPEVRLAPDFCRSFFLFLHAALVCFRFDLDAPSEASLFKCTGILPLVVTPFSKSTDRNMGLGEQKYGDTDFQTSDSAENK